MADKARASVTPAKKTKSPAVATSSKFNLKPTHPKTSEMVINAIKELNERRGSSLQAIKKYISARYMVDAVKLAPFIRKYLKSGVQSGELIQTKGTGASGSFKLKAKSPASKSAAKHTTKTFAASTAASTKKALPSKAEPVATKDKKAAAAMRKPAAKVKSTAAVKSKQATPKAKQTIKTPMKSKKPEPKMVVQKVKIVDKKRAGKK